MFFGVSFGIGILVGIFVAWKHAKSQDDVSFLRVQPARGNSCLGILSIEIKAQRFLFPQNVNQKGNLNFHPEKNSLRSLLSIPVARVPLSLASHFFPVYQKADTKHKESLAEKELTEKKAVWAPLLTPIILDEGKTHACFLPPLIAPPDAAIPFRVGVQIITPISGTNRCQVNHGVEEPEGPRIEQENPFAILSWHSLFENAIAIQRKINN